MIARNTMAITFLLVGRFKKFKNRLLGNFEVFKHHSEKNSTYIDFGTKNVEKTIDLCNNSTYKIRLIAINSYATMKGNKQTFEKFRLGR